MITIIQDKNSNQRSIKNSNQGNVNTSNQGNVNTSNQGNVNTSNQGNVNTISTISIKPKKRRLPNWTDTSGHNFSSSSIIEIDTNKKFILKLQFLSAIENINLSAIKNINLSAIEDIKRDIFINKIIEDFYNNIYLKEKNILPYLKPKIESDTTLKIEIKNKNLKYVKEMTLSNEKDFLEFFLPEQINILLKKQSETY